MTTWDDSIILCVVRYTQHPYMILDVWYCHNSSISYPTHPSSMSFITSVTYLTYPIHTHATCSSSNLVYLLTCTVCDAFLSGNVLYLRILTINPFRSQSTSIPFIKYSTPIVEYRCFGIPLKDSSQKWNEQEDKHSSSMISETKDIGS